MAKSVLLKIDTGIVTIPAVRAQNEPDLKGQIIRDALIPFEARCTVGEIRIKGKLQDRVVRSSKTNHLHFYQCIRLEKIAPSDQLAVNVMSAYRYNLPTQKKYWVGWRPDGIGRVEPIEVNWFTALPGSGIHFGFIRMNPYHGLYDYGAFRMSRFYFIKTEATEFNVNGVTDLHICPHMGEPFILAQDKITLTTAQPVY